MLQGLVKRNPKSHTYLYVAIHLRQMIIKVMDIYKGFLFLQSVYISRLTQCAQTY